MQADGAGAVRQLTQSKNLQFPHFFTPDGKRLVFTEATSGTSGEIRSVSVDIPSGQMKAGEPKTHLKTSTAPTFAALSPSGRWLAYQDSQEGRFEVYVRAFPDTGVQVRISNNGGTMPSWSRNGRELFYRTMDQRIMVTHYAVKGEVFVPDKPQVWFGKQLANIGLAVNLDLAPDGKHFLALMPAEGSVPRDRQSHVSLFVNYFDEVRRRMAGGGR